MSRLYFRFLNSGFFDFTLYAFTVVLAFHAFNSRDEIAQASVPVWPAVCAVIFLILCGAFIAKHLYKDRLRAMMGENKDEVYQYESKIEELNNEISSLNEKLLYERHQASNRSEEATILKGNAKKLKEELNEKNLKEKRTRVNPGETERKYRFLKTAFHPDRFRSVHKKEEAEKMLKEVEQTNLELKCNNVKLISGDMRRSDNCYNELD